MLEVQNMEAEMSVLGAILLDNESFMDAMGVVSGSDFTNSQHANIYEAMVRLDADSKPIDLVTVTAELKKEGQYESIGSPLLNELLDYVPTASNLSYYAKLVKDSSLYRKARSAASESLSANEGETIEDYLDRCESSFLTLRDNISSDDIQVGKKVLMACMKNLGERHEQKDVITGLRTGIMALDYKLSGLHGGELIIIAGRPAMGKSTLVQNIGEFIMLERYPKIGSGAVLAFSLEMPATQWVDRMVCSQGKVDNTNYRSGNLEDDEWPRATEASTKIGNMKFFIDDNPGLNIMELRAKARRVHRKNKLSLIVIDYLQLMSIKGDNRNEGLGEITRQLKCLAKELNIPIIALSQLNRSVENRTDKRPVMSDLRESGAIEQDADIIAFVYRETVYCEACNSGKCSSNHQRDAEIIIRKQRNGSIGTVHSAFIGEHFRFENVTQREED